MASAELEEFRKALRAGQRNYRECLAKGNYPYLQVLDDILQHVTIESTVPVGVMEIPAKRIVGTKTQGRKTAFAPNFMPLLDEKSEFGNKWIALCDAQMTEGIRDPIKVYEYMNHFYVQEGNKRVSVLKYFGATEITGSVTRLIPPRTQEKENKIYYEFLDFYAVTKINQFWFTQEGSFARLVAATGKTLTETWTQEERANLITLYYRFDALFTTENSITSSDALLRYIEIYGYETAQNKTVDEIQKEIASIRNELLVLTQQDPLKVSLDPAQQTARPLFEKLFTSTPSTLQIAFVHEKTAETSGWTYAHEMGRGELIEAFPQTVVTVCYDDVIVEENGDAIVEQAIADGADVVFTTTPKLMAASLKAAVRHPQVKILNCSLNMTHPDIRTYYGRIHEAKFLMGAIAGVLADDNKIGYVATYPTYSMTAGINAFAMGAKMVNPRAQIYLEWTSVKNRDIEKEFAKNGVSIISNLDMQAPQHSSPKFGLYRIEDGKIHNYAMPFWQWGKFYVNIVQSIFDGTWNEKADARAINYWWGMSAGVVEVVCSRSLPADTARLVELLRTAICHHEFEPFSGVIVGQGGVNYGKAGTEMTPEKIITMDWLAENVLGHIPDFEELIDVAKPLVLLQGIGRETI